MSILIRGMEMPNICAHCFLDASKCDLHAKVNIWRERHPNCPLIELPPHGRLIDADVFAENIKNVSIRQGYKNTLIDEYLSVDDVFDAIIDELTGKTLYGFELNPTIIEAEGSET